MVRRQGNIFYDINTARACITMNYKPVREICVSDHIMLPSECKSELRSIMTYYFATEHNELNPLIQRFFLLYTETTKPHFLAALRMSL